MAGVKGERLRFIFSPLPPTPGGISYYTHTLATALAKTEGSENVCVITDGENPSFPGPYKIIGYRKFYYSSLPKDGIPVYMLGTQFHHRYIYQFVFSHPGILVLHDPYISIGRLNPQSVFFSANEWEDEVRYAYPEIQPGWRCVLKTGRMISVLPYALPLYETLVEFSAATVVHNPDTALMLGLQYGPRIRYLPMGIPDLDALLQIDRTEGLVLRKKLGWGSEDLVLGQFGGFERYKQIDLIFKVVHELKKQGYQVRLLLVGYGEPDNIDSLVKTMGLADDIRWFSSVSREEYRQWLSVIDVGLNLRFPPVGETSLSTLEMMATGVPIITFRHRFSVHYPDHAVIKGPPFNPTHWIVRTLISFMENPDRRLQMGGAARAWVRKHHRFETMVDGYQQLFSEWPSLIQAWRRPRPSFPEHLRPFSDRVVDHVSSGFPHGPLREMVCHRIYQVLKEVDPVPATPLIGKERELSSRDF